MTSARRLAAKRDKNEREIIDALEMVGASVVQLSDKGVPDLLVGYHEENTLLEVKAAKGKLTQEQADWFDNWRGQAKVVRSVDDALRAIGAID